MELHLKNFKDPELSRYVRLACNFYADMLMHKNLTNNLDVTIHKTKLGRQDTGFCTYDDDNFKPRMFTIEVHSGLGRRSLFDTLAHEFVHVKQYATGELAERIRWPYSRWKGCEVVEEDTNYWDLPWEIEAYGRSPGLFSRFIKTHDLRKYFGYREYDKKQSST
jgi:hypothetical protein